MIAITLIQLVETMPQTKEVEQFLKSIGPFYELADEDEEEESENLPDRPPEDGKEKNSIPKLNKNDNTGHSPYLIVIVTLSNVCR